MLRFFNQYFSIRKIIFILGEGLFIFASLLIGFWVLGQMLNVPPDKFYFIKAAAITIIAQLSLYYNDLYKFKYSENYLDIGIKICRALGFIAVLMSVLIYFFPIVNIHGLVVVLSMVSAAVMLVSWRIGYRYVVKQGILNQNLMLIGSSEIRDSIKSEIYSRQDCGYSIVIEIPESEDRDTLTLNCLLGNDQQYQLHKIASERGVKKIVVCIKEKRQRFPTKELLKCRMEGIEVIEGNSFYEMLTGKVLAKSISPGWLIFSNGFNKNRNQLVSKRAIDLTLSLFLIVLYAPLIALISILIKIDSRGPVIYAQERVGRSKKPFRLYKFRSMIADAEKATGPVWCEDNDCRITRVGKWIRKLRLDEIPQLWNVLKGEMSFIGPRPERAYFVERLQRIIPFYNERFTVKPGITGWAQISYGYGATDSDALEKLNYDLFYIKNMSVFMDLLIVTRTIKIVIFGEGAR
jgi:sugar transferase (PEP-CTERM system associated)